VLPKFVETSAWRWAGHYYAEEADNFDNDGHDLYAVATYVVPTARGWP